MKWLSYFLILLVSVSCVTKEAEPIKLNSDACEFCKMKISDGKFGAELITSKGRIYKFDDMHCMISYHKENLTTNIQSFYIHDFSQNNKSKWEIALLGSLDDLELKLNHSFATIFK